MLLPLTATGQISFWRSDSDTNGDGVVNAADIVTIVNTIMGKAPSVNGGRISYPLYEEMLDSYYFPKEEKKLNNFIEKIQKRAGTGVYQIALVTDTHDGGKYVDDGKYALRTISMFNRIASHVDLCMHGGDLSCDYGTSRKRLFSYMQEAINKFKIPAGKNFLLTMGNHDNNIDPFIEVNPYEVDRFQTYYDENFDVINQQNPYRGGNIYKKTDPELISDDLFRIIQSTNAPANAIWGKGAYYYWDVPSMKIRFIVANSYPTNEDGTDGTSEEYKWFSRTALNLSRKGADADKWLVIVLRHTEATSDNLFAEIIKAFVSGKTVTLGHEVVDYGKTNGGGIKLVHFHGHEHSYAGYSNMNNYLDLGFRHGYVEKDKLGDLGYYAIYVLSIDIVNKRIISDCTFYQHTEVFDYDDSIALLHVGDWLRIARSGLSKSAKWTSSNSNIAIVKDMTVTGMGVGTATITGTENGVTKTYTVKVTADSY